MNKKEVYSLVQTLIGIYDANQDGYLEDREVEALILDVMSDQRLNITQKTLRAMCNYIERNNNGKIGREELVSIFMKADLDAKE